MPAYGIPGVAVGQRRSRFIGIATIGVLVLAVVGWKVVPNGADDGMLAVTLLTEQVGEGIESGSDVRFDGVKVGTIASLDSATDGRQRIGLHLSQSQLFGLTDALSIDYAPGNLFGISELELRPGEGGTTLTNGTVVNLTGPNAKRAYDATISTLIRSIGTITTDVLTPQFTEMVSKVAHDTRAFTPIFQAIIDLARSITETQQYPTSFLLGQLGDALAGAPPTLDGGFKLLYGPFSNEYMKSEEHRLRLDATVAVIVEQLIPELGDTAAAAQPYFQGYTDGMLAPLLSMLAGTVSAPQRSARELGVLLDRTTNALHDTPDGPVLNLDVDLRGVPALAVPLLGGISAPAPVGDR